LNGSASMAFFVRPFTRDHIVRLRSVLLVPMPET
jgi:hypothetical protein